MATQTTIGLDLVEYAPPEPLWSAAHSGPGRSLFESDAMRNDVASQVTTSEEAPPAHAHIAKSQAFIMIAQLFGINFISSFSNGLLSIGLPTITTAINIPGNLLLWPSSVFYLTMGSCLLIAGSIADVIGPRKVNLPGTLLTAVMVLASGFAKDAITLIMFRAVQGIANAMVVPTAVSLVANNVDEGTARNVGFASIFLSMPLGYALGMVLGGLFVSGPGYEFGYYAGGATGLVLFVVGIWALPKDPELPSLKSTFKRLATEIDWVGAGIASASIALLSYVLAMLSANTTHIAEPVNIALLTISLLLLPTFAFWMRYQVKRGRPALIPNHLWRNFPFTSVCLMILLCNAVLNCLEIYCSLFFQEVQLLSATQAAIRILPSVVIGAALSLLVGTLVNRLPVMVLIMVSSVLAAGSPLLMAVIDPFWSYWIMAFWAQVLAPLSVDVLFTVGTIVVSEAFPKKTQGLAGAVFNTFAQVGGSVGLCLSSVISISVTQKSSFVDKESPQALMQGYRATFWTLFAWTITACVIGGFGLRRLGKVGVKRD